MIPDSDTMTIFVSEYEALKVRIAELEAQRDKLLAALKLFTAYAPQFIVGQAFAEVRVAWIEMKFALDTIAELERTDKDASPLQSKSGQTGPER